LIALPEIPYPHVRSFTVTAPLTSQ